MIGRDRVITVLAVAALSLAWGCGSKWQNYEEEFLRSGIAGGTSAPDWVAGPVPTDPDRVYFVGRGIGHDVLDERGAYDEARQHVLEQVGNYVRTRIDATLSSSEDSRGARYLPLESTYQGLSNDYSLKTLAITGDLVEHDIYWEQWYLQEYPERWLSLQAYDNRIKRYKCWLLASISREDMEKRLQETEELLDWMKDMREIEAAEPDKLYYIVAD